MFPRIIDYVYWTLKERMEAMPNNGEAVWNALHVPMALHQVCGRKGGVVLCEVCDGHFNIVFFVMKQCYCIS